MGTPETNLPILSDHPMNLRQDDLERDYYHDVRWFKLLFLMVFASVSVETFVFVHTDRHGELCHAIEAAESKLSEETFHEKHADLKSFIHENVKVCIDQKLTRFEHRTRERHSHSEQSSKSLSDAMTSLGSQLSMLQSIVECNISRMEYCDSCSYASSLSNDWRLPPA